MELKKKTPNRIRKAVFPVAGMGTRFLPATKASPKEMLPVVDRPLIQYAVEEALQAGIIELVFITGRGKRAIEDHFDEDDAIEAKLQAKGKQELLKSVQNIIPKYASCTYVRQPRALGLGHAVLCAANVIGDEPFAVILADDLIDSNPSAIEQMTKIYRAHRCSVLGVQKVTQQDASQYGIVKSRLLAAPRLHVIAGIVEKPKPGKAPSNLGVVGRYILTPRIFHHLRRVKPGTGGEIQLTDGIASLLKEEKVFAYEFDGTRYDCGSKLGYLKATLAYAVKHPEVGEEFSSYLSSLGCRLPKSGRV
ncbi:MAG TPA: UTP--glucose-1-phosphate uridylyltransferase GalU [Burkholderiales bacterium]|nr:UTP--glucose-1-phosphate uridylyltransferase GalU [Burkholderiales bacterium]